jgi:hypothetical protein
MCSGSVQAWGLKTHLWIAEKILDELKAGDCTLSVGLPQAYRMTRNECEAIKAHPEFFRAGALGPDALPDIVSGQMTVHPGIDDKDRADAWGTDDFLKHVAAKASTPEEIAFALGMQTHAAGDVFAHTYVNTYAGDIFVLTDEAAVELRHFALEKYIEKATPTVFGKYDGQTLRAPSRFISDTLINHCEVQNQYRSVAPVLHLRAMARQTYKAKLWLAVRKGDHAEAKRLAECLGRETSVVRKPAFDSYLKSTFGLPSQSALAVIEAPDELELAMREVNEAAALEAGAGSAMSSFRYSYGGAAMVRTPSQLVTSILEDIVRGMESATDEYVNASMTVSIALLNGDDKAFKPYQQWQKCWSGVYLGVPYDVQTGLCRFHQKYDAFKRALPWSSKYYEVKDYFVGLLTVRAERLGKDVLSQLREPADGDLLQVMLHPDLADGAYLNAKFMQPAEKKLLLVPAMADKVNADMGNRPGAIATFKEDKFYALKYSLTLAKLSILDIQEANAMYRDHVGPAAKSIFSDGAPLYPAGPYRTPMLASAIRSIDGNHQWQKYGMPYPRTVSIVDSPQERERRRYGYAWSEAVPKGFRLFVDPQAREKIFAVLFPRPFIGEINTLLQKDYPFATCAAYPFPITSGLNGQACTSDQRCNAAAGNQAALSLDPNGCAQ